MELKIIGNRESFYLTQNVDFLEISLIGNFDLYSDSRIRFIYDHQEYSFRNRKDLFKFSERVKGAEREKIGFLLQEFEFPPGFSNSFIRKSQTETSLFKSLFLIEYWLDLHLSKKNFLHDPSIESLIFDNFVVEYTSRPGTQEDIYFIGKELIQKSNEPYLKKLKEINLLAELRLRDYDREIISFFVPLLKPGIPKEYFRIKSEGLGAYKLWQKILNARDFRISTWFKERY